MEIRSVEIKVARHRIQPYGIRGGSISIPKIWAQENDVGPGDYVDIYIDEAGRMVIPPPEKDKNEPG